MKKNLLILLSVFGLLLAGCPTPTETQVTIKFDANGGKGSMKEMTVDNGSEVTLTANTFTRDGYTFKGWNDAKDGKGKSYADKAKVKPTANMTLFAQWEVKTVDITFNNNPTEGSGAEVLEAKQTVSVGQESVIEGPADWTLDGYTFLGWAKEKTAAAAEFTNGGKITVTEAVTLYAVWLKQETGKVSITFDGNGADEGSAMAPQIVDENATVTLSKNTYTKTGYTFLGWSTDQAADTQEYADEAEITVNTEDVTLYAVWQKDEIQKQTFGITNEGMETGTYAVDIVTLTFKKTSAWEWPADLEVTLSAKKGEEAVTGAVTLNKDSDTVTVADTLTAGSYTYSVTFSAEGYDDLILTWTVTVEAETPAVQPVTDLTATSGDGKITVTWTASATADATYKLTYTAGTAESTEVNPATSPYELEQVVVGVEYTFTVVAVKDAEESAPVTATATYVIPETITRGDKTFRLVKGIDFNGNGSNGIVGKTETIADLTAFTKGSNLFVKNNGTQKGEINGSYLTFENLTGEYTAYQFSVADGDSSNVVYAEAVAKIENNNNLTIGLSSTGITGSEHYGWQHGILYGKDNTNWKVGIWSKGGYANINPAVTAKQLTPFGVYFTDKNTDVTYYANGGAGITLPQQGGAGNLLSQQTTYWMSLGADGASKSNTCSIDYIAFYEADEIAP